MNRFEKNLEELRNLIIDPYNFIYTYTGSIIHQVDLDRELNKKQIDDLSLDIIDEVKNFRKKCQNNLKSDELINTIEMHKVSLESLNSIFEKMNLEPVIFENQRKIKADLLSSKCRNIITALKENILDRKKFILKSFPPIIEGQVEKK